jgi:hypothetical protein
MKIKDVSINGVAPDGRLVINISTKLFISFERLNVENGKINVDDLEKLHFFGIKERDEMLEMGIW